MKRLTAAAIALSLFAAASVSGAQDRHDYQDRRDGSIEHRDFDNRGDDGRRAWQYEHDRGERDWRQERRDDHADWRDHRYWQERHDRDWADGRFRDNDYRRPWGYREHNWQRGERLPVSYYAPSYVLGDYGAYGLGQPPYGCHWVRVNNDVVLAAIATGVVFDVIYHAF